MYCCLFKFREVLCDQMSSCWPLYEALFSVEWLHNDSWVWRFSVSSVEVATSCARLVTTSYKTTEKPDLVLPHVINTLSDLSNPLS